jgi:RNA polymerase-binding transcription factor DksA
MKTTKKKTASKPAKKKVQTKPARAAKLSKATRSAKPSPKTKKPAKRTKPVRAAKSVKSARSTAKPARSAKTSRSSKKRVHCEFCGADIPPQRLEVLPYTTTCVQCSQTKPYSEAQIIGLNGEEGEQNRLNMEDFEETDTDYSAPYNEQW